MSRLRTSAGLVAVAVGVSVAVGGPQVFSAAWKAVWTHIDVGVLALAVFLTLRRVAPKGSLKLPAVVAVAGLILLGIKHDFWDLARAFAVSGVGLAIVGAHAVLTAVAQHRETADPVQRLTAVLRNSELRVGTGDPMPGYLAITGVGADVLIDLSGAAWPDGKEYLEIASSCWAGRIDITVPDSWGVVAGRVHRTWHTNFDGQLDLPEAFSYPFDDFTTVEEELGRKRFDGLVFVHVIGAWGRVGVRRPGALATDQSSSSDGSTSSLS